MKPFERVVTEFGQMVLRVCQAVLSQSDAEDAWAETFLAALKAYPDLPEDANVEAWLVTIAHRKAIDARRAQMRRPLVVERVPEHPAQAARPEDWDVDLWNALQALPDKQRSAVAYHYLGGLPYKEIASVLGGNTEAARRAASDGIKALRATYAHTSRVKGEIQ